MKNNEKEENKTKNKRKNTNLLACLEILNNLRTLLNVGIFFFGKNAITTIATSTSNCCKSRSCSSSLFNSCFCKSTDAHTIVNHVTVFIFDVFSNSFLLNDRLNVIPSAPLTISAEYLGYSCDDQVEYQWILYEGDKDAKWMQILSNLDNSKVFAVDSSTLKDNTKYRLQLTVLLSNGTPSTSVQVFKTAVLPRDGSCTITPDIGEAVYTSFELLCSGWFALNEIFTYEVQISGDGDIHYTLYYGRLDKQHLVLPQGNASRGYLYHVKVFVSRSNGATSELEIPVTV